jgi:hypothetical protein
MDVPSGGQIHEDGLARRSTNGRHAVGEKKGMTDE